MTEDQVANILQAWTLWAGLLLLLLVTLPLGVMLWWNSRDLERKVDRLLEARTTGAGAS